MSDDHSARLELPYLAAGQMQKHVTLNEAMTRLDALVQTAVVSRTATAQPVSPPDGGLWILPTGATGVDWGARPAGTLVRFEAGGWSAVPAPEGLVVLVVDAAELVVRHWDGWVPLGRRLGEIQDLGRLGIGATADSWNPFLAKLNNALWTAREAAYGGTGDLRLTLNKETAGHVLSLVFQSGYGGRAELGLVGDDDLRLKVSADGSEWLDDFAVERATGRAVFAQGAARRSVTRFTAPGTWTPPAWARSVEAVAVGGGGGGGSGAFGTSGARPGGGGGGAGGVSRSEWPADLLAAGLTVTVGAGGSGGSGGAGATGGDSVIELGGAAVLTGAGGSGGQGGGAGGAGGGGGAGAPASNAGGSSGVAASGGSGGGHERPDAAGGGGAGGGLDGPGVVRAGGAGGDGAILVVKAAGGAGGAGAGAAGATSPQPALHWAGGGGGGGGAAASGAGHAGGAGGGAGAGGGGGGAGVAAGGAGGPGAAGTVWIVALG
ncbi:DUF2793 domain-containing protein [Brevundimonas sp. Root1423]|uniref:DUF2793 domain-containing protein n=1 Tax=Brevundimonas sp. Root1423 TaxID=1736462 RepID=UPI0006F9C17B|nr:DUF2793 domain-containing protein [Brevundimonas sp. Root1423]KQY84629.1 hypothetical protein ASD25_06220 [Brevundimonas sp. Root1423]